MSVNNMTLAYGATLAATGGTSKTFKKTDQEVKNGIMVVDSSSTDYRTRITVMAKVKPPYYDSQTGEYTKGRKTITLTQPFVKASGKVEFPLVRIEVEDHPELALSDITEMRKRAAQLLFDTDLDDFFNLGNTD